jgi:hypothetical protein
MALENTPTFRGFSLYTFVDRYGEACRIQKSSLAFEDCIWLGVKGRVQAMAPGGWVDLEVPPGSVFTDSMHLTREMVAEMLPILQRFVDTGDL